MKTKVGQKWYQSSALSSLFRQLFFLYLILIGHHPLKSIKPVLALTITKISFVGSMQRRLQIPCSGMLILTIFCMLVSSFPFMAISVLSSPASVAQNLPFLLRICSVLQIFCIQLQQSANFCDRCCSACISSAKCNKLGSATSFFAAGANLIHKSLCQ